MFSELDFKITADAENYQRIAGIDHLALPVILGIDHLALPVILGIGSGIAI